MGKERRTTREKTVRPPIRVAVTDPASHTAEEAGATT